MKRTIFITGTDTGVGKTVLTALLARFLREEGVAVAALKPVCSGGRQDARILHRALGGALRLDEINPWYFRAPVAPRLAAEREKKRVTLAAMLAHIRSVRGNFSVVLVEGAGGLLSPLGSGFNSCDAIRALRATPVVVAPNRLGVINHILLTLGALPPALRPRAQVVLMAPAKPDAATASNLRLLEQLSIRNVRRLPRFGPDPLTTALAGDEVRQTLAAIAGLDQVGDTKNRTVSKELLLPTVRRLS